MKSDTSCIRVSDTGICPYCKSKRLVKNGFTKNGKQQYHFKNCSKRSIDFYCYKSYQVNDKQIIQLTKEGLGIRSTARVLQLSTTTLLKRIIKIARSLTSPQLINGRIYEVDEMRTYLRNKNNVLWIAYALERKTKSVVSFAIGRRTKRTLQNVISTLQLSNPKKIYTDGLKQYKSIIDKNIHFVTRFGTNHIERKNLSIRTHLKRLNRKTICYSKSFSVLMCIMRIYFWG